MAKAKTAVATKPRKKAVTKAKPAGAAKPKKAKSGTSGFETLSKLVDHPLVADLLAVGAMAAVAAIAEDGFSGKKDKGKGKKGGSTKAVKAAGKAAAAAIGKRLLTEVEQIRKVSKTEAK